MTAQDIAKEQESVDMLTAMMGETVSDPEIARRVLRKCNGDLQKAATAILEGDRGEDRPKSPVRKTELKPYSSPCKLSFLWFIVALPKWDSFWTEKEFASH